MSLSSLRRTRGPRNTFRPELDPLEDRTLLAASVSLSGTTLTINGDNNDNKIVLSDDGKGTITGTVDGKSLNGGLGFAGITDIIVKGKQGNDKISYTLTDKLTTARNLSIDLGPDNDTCTIDMGGKELAANFTLSSGCGPGDDKYTISNIGQVDKGMKFSATVNGQAGQDTFSASFAGDILGTAEVTWNGGGDTSSGLVFPGKLISPILGFPFPLAKTDIDKATFNMSSDVDIAAGASLSITSTGSNVGSATKGGVTTPGLSYQGEVDGTLNVNLTGGPGNTVLVTKIIADPDTSSPSLSTLGTINVKMDGAKGDDTLALLFTNNSGGTTSFTKSSPTIPFNIIGGTGKDKSIVLTATAGAISIAPDVETQVVI